jgi:hypothetical protein
MHCAAGDRAGLMRPYLPRTAKLPLAFIDLTLSSETVISPTASLLKTMEVATPRSNWPVSWSPLMKTTTSGGGLGALICAPVRAGMENNTATKK